MRIIRFLADDGRVLHGREEADGSATVLLDGRGILGSGAAFAGPGAFAMLRGKIALVADDDANMRTLVCTVLQKVGCECILCEDGAAAMTALREHAVDLVVSDIMMPHYNGYEIFAAARQRYPDMPIVLITGFGYDPNHCLVKATKAGLAAVLYKPFTPQQLLEELRKALQASAGTLNGALIPTPESVRVAKLLAPLLPCDIFCIGQNYRPAVAREPAREPVGVAASARARETPDPRLPAERFILHETLEVFLKPAGCTQDPGEPIRIPSFESVDPHVDVEGELAVIIATAAHNVAESDAMSHVLGYTIANDVTARAWQLQGNGSPQWMRGKGFDTFCPLGPAIVSPPDLPDLASIEIRTYINDRLVRRGRTSDMVRTVPRIISELSQHMTLRPGSVILTGAPPRLGDSAAIAAPLRPGDEVVIEIDGLGRLSNPVTGT